MIAKRALATLYNQTVMAQLVWRDYEPEFAGKQGDTITIRKPPTFTAQEFNRGTGIVVQDATETGIPMTLNHFADVSFGVTAEDLTLKIDDFGEQFLDPAMEAINQKIEKDLLLLRSDVVNTVGTTAGELWSAPEALIAARRVLTQNKVPQTERRAVVGAVTAGEWLKTDLLKKADARGDTLGLREASLGNRVFGFDAYETNSVIVPTPGTGISTTEVNLAFHKTAFALAMRPLAIPLGARDRSAIADYKGFGLRVTYDYDIKTKMDIISIDTLYGCKTIDATRAVTIRGALGA
ncbi:hypothetical protein JNW90_10605 [Micromonospora sp. STR1s_5]|nr:hypothetical protein [Micromonospora sp. STR1s_5]